MRYRMLAIAILTLSFVITSSSEAGLVLVTDPAAATWNDSVHWGQLGTDGTTLASSVNATSARGRTVTATTSDSSGLYRLDEGTGWVGNFSPGDSLLTNGTPTYAPLMISFDIPLTGVGANIQRDQGGAFTATISVYSGNVLLGTFTEDGDSNSLEDGSAIFLGVKNTNPYTDPVITKIVFGLTIESQSVPNADFAINSVRMSLLPEPSTILSAALAALGTLVEARRRRLCVDPKPRRRREAAGKYSAAPRRVDAGAW
jgi:hypothetical protein